MKKLYVLLMVLMGAVQMTKAQTASAYYFKAKADVPLEDISAGATTLINPLEDRVQSGSVTFFPFTFAGTSYNQFSVSEDGVIVLGNSVYNPYPYDNYFEQSHSIPPIVIGATYPILLPWGEDLYTPANGTVAYKMTGAAPLRKLVIEFRVRSAEDDHPGDGYTKTFQVWLAEGSNTIQFVYGDIETVWSNSANIGIATSGSDFLSVNSANNTVSSTVVSSNSDGVYPEVQPSLPSEGTSYIFSPTPIVDVPPATNPILASLAVLPEYTVWGQQKRTIYLGYGLQSVLLFAKARGGNPAATGYTYSWSPAIGLSNPNVPFPIASPKVTTTYTVTITDGHGNTIQKSVTIRVIDVRCGEKIKVCKREKTHTKEVCVNKRDVDELLWKGGTLGGCVVAGGEQSMAAPAGKIADLSGEMEEVKRGDATVYPNPSSGMFTVQLPADAQQTTLTVFDINGKAVLQKMAGAYQQGVQLDLTNNAPGVYLVKMVNQGKVTTSKVIVQ